MIDYILMSDIRTKLLLGTTITSVSLMLVMAVSLGAVQYNQPSAASTLGLMGHFEIIVENPDGTVSYAQGDNVVTGAGKDAAGDRLFDSTSTQPVFNCIILGNGTNSAAAVTINAALVNTGIDCGTTVGSDAGTNDPGGDAQVNSITSVHTISALDCPTTCTLTEVALGDSTLTAALTPTGLTFAHTGLDADVQANNGADVTTIYKVATGGTVPPP